MLLISSKKLRPSIGISGPVGWYHEAAGVGSIYFPDSQILIILDPDLTPLPAPTIPGWNTLGRPSAPKRGTIGFNLDTNALEFYDGTSWH